MGRNLPELLLLIRSQIRLDILGVTPNQVYADGYHNVKVNDPGATPLSLLFAAHRSFRTPPDPGIKSPASG
jgi:hypothetical protein